jgi:hypothetical protein
LLHGFDFTHIHRRGGSISILETMAISRGYRTVACIAVFCFAYTVFAEKARLPDIDSQLIARMSTQEIEDQIQVGR